jgi:triacylglycerol esterase/lipase EstA (alpha/beta hydrolase family)
MGGLIIFLHGLRGDRTHWSDVPIYVESALSSFTTVSLEYSAEVLGHADVKKSGSQILTKIQTTYADCDPIFLVGYSMGGLVAREVCLQLLESQDDETKQLLQRVPAAITFGTPMMN